MGRTDGLDLVAEDLNLDEWIEARWRPEWFRVDSRWGPMVVNRFDVYIGRAFIQFGEYGRDEVDRLLRLAAGRPGLVLDVGANCGAIARPLLEAGLDVIAFEPQPEVRALLEVNVALRSRGMAVVQAEALGEEAGVMHLGPIDYARPGNFGGVELKAGPVDGGSLVPMTTLDAWWGREEEVLVSLLKVDVEGMERLVLSGGRAMLAACRPLLYIEADRPGELAALGQLLRDLGYQWEMHTPDLYSPANHFRNQANPYGRTVSMNWMAWPKGDRRPRV